jgi:uncharacterized protein
MDKQIYISLPVSDLVKSTEFYKKLGFTKQEDWSMDGQVACMLWSDAIYVMLTAKEHYQTYINGRVIVDAKKCSQALLSLTLGSREEVDAIVNVANENGGSSYPFHSGMDFMYNIMIEDLDGHVWETVYMDTSQFPEA